MKTLLRNSCLFLLAVCAAASAAIAQTNAPASPNLPPAGARPPASKRFSGKIISVDTQAKSFTLEGLVKDEIQIKTSTRIFKVRQLATFEDLAVGQQVTGTKRADGTNWVASMVRVGDPRQIPPEPPAK